MTSGRVHPEKPEGPAAGDPHLPASHRAPPRSSPSSSARPSAYAIRMPREDQIHRVPPPDNVHSYDARAGCAEWVLCCILASLFPLFLLAVAQAVAESALYSKFRPKDLGYSIGSLSVSGLNLSDAGGPLSPEFDVAVRAENPSEKVSIYYFDGSSVSVSYDGLRLARGAWPMFRQPMRNVTVIRTALKGSGLVLPSDARQNLVTAQSRGAVPLRLRFKIPAEVEYGYGAIISSLLYVIVQCDLTVDKLTADANITSESCALKLRHFGLL